MFSLKDDVLFSQRLIELCLDLFQLSLRVVITHGTPSIVILDRALSMQEDSDDDSQKQHNQDDEEVLTFGIHLSMPWLRRQGCAVLLMVEAAAEAASSVRCHVSCGVQALPARCRHLLPLASCVGTLQTCVESVATRSVDLPHLAQRCERLAQHHMPADSSVALHCGQTPLS